MALDPFTAGFDLIKTRDIRKELSAIESRLSVVESRLK